MALELEELRREQAGYEQQIQAVDEAMAAIQEQIDSMACTVSQNKVYDVVVVVVVSWLCSELLVPQEIGHTSFMDFVIESFWLFFFFLAV